MTVTLVPILGRADEYLHTKYGVEPRPLDGGAFLDYYRSASAPPMRPEDPIGVAVYASAYSHPSCPRGKPLTWSRTSPLRLSALISVARACPALLESVAWLHGGHSSPEEEWRILVHSSLGWFKEVQVEGGADPSSPRVVAMADLYWRQVLESGVSLPRDLAREVRAAVLLAHLPAPRSQPDLTDEVHVVMGDYCRAHSEGQERAWYFLGRDGVLRLNRRGFRDALKAAGEAPSNGPGAMVCSPLRDRAWDGPEPAEDAEPDPAQARMLSLLGSLERLDDLPRFTEKERAVLTGTLRMARDGVLPPVLGGREHRRMLSEIGVPISQPGLLKLWPRVAAKLRAAS
jgi:hypothetical protein